MRAIALGFPRDELADIVRLGLLPGPMVPVHESVRRIQLIGKLVVLDELAGEALDRCAVRLEAP